MAHYKVLQIARNGTPLVSEFHGYHAEDIARRLYRDLQGVKRSLMVFLFDSPELKPELWEWTIDRYWRSPELTMTVKDDAETVERT